MKLKHLATLGLAALAATAVPAQDPKAKAAGQPAAADAGSFTDEQLLEEFGWFIGKRVGLPELSFTKEELDVLVKGLLNAANGKDTPYELEKIGPKMDEFMQKKQQVYVDKQKTKNASVNTDFFAKLKENKNIVELPSGLRYEIVKPGDGPAPKPSDTVRVHYHGTLITGAVFDSSVQRGQPIDFKLSEVIPGWTEGLQKISKGGKIKLYVPPQLAYGDDGRPGIPPSSTLIFDVDLLDINPGAAAQPAKK